MPPAERRDLDHRPEVEPEPHASLLSRLGAVVLLILWGCVCALLIPFVWFIAKECDHND